MPSSTYMFLIARDNRRGARLVHFLPEGGSVELPPYRVEREGNVVLVHTPTYTLRLEEPRAINLTDYVLEFVPMNAVLSPENVERVMYELERLTFDEGLSERGRRIARLLGALIGLRSVSTLPETIKEGVILAIHRLTGERIGEIISRTEEIARKVEEELRATLARASPDEVAPVFNAVLAP